MDADDISPLYRLEEQIKILKENPQLDILGGYIEEYDEKMQQISAIRKVPLRQKQIERFIKTQTPFNHGTVMMKKKSVIAAGNYDNIGFEDYDLWARMLINGCKMQNTEMILCKFRTGNEMYKRRSGIKQIKKAIEIENRLLKYKIINIFQYTCNIIIRSIFAIIPINIKKILYPKCIRRI